MSKAIITAHFLERISQIASTGWERRLNYPSPKEAVPNITLGAHPSATGEGTLYPSYSGFFRTDVPSSQYSHQDGRNWWQ